MQRSAPANESRRVIKLLMFTVPTRRHTHHRQGTCSRRRQGSIQVHIICESQGCHIQVVQEWRGSGWWPHIFLYHHKSWPRVAWCDHHMWGQQRRWDDTSISCHERTLRTCLLTSLNWCKSGLEWFRSQADMWRIGKSPAGYHLAIREFAPSSEYRSWIGYSRDKLWIGRKICLQSFSLRIPGDLCLDSSIH